ncbi:mitochondrial carrier domain-containing protein [Macrophomina phaseolina]|uniref:Mitochondrial carrier domain-containing protein n=1 Tax=Macrophomina phaseolina TaxID=35725 RepID=A0ABQ8G501_9PEZI|nr:mitochondrial carrier domain-containing protein [Macrophomina phaseolina]
MAGDDAPQTPAHVSLLAGGTAGAIEAAITYPFEFAKTRVQLRNEQAAAAAAATPRKSPNPFLVIRDVVRNEGPRALYAGCTSLVIGSVGKDGVRFLSFDVIKNAFADGETGTLSPLRNLGAGMTAGVVASITAVTPTERVKTALIDDARSGGERRFQGSLVKAIGGVVRDDGVVRGLYRGFAGTTMKQASATACRMGTYNILKDAERVRHIEQTAAVNFANGSVAGVVTTYATQPFDTIKTRCQSARGETTVQAIRGIWEDGGVRTFWRGTVMRLGRTIFSGGILFTCYERAVKILDPLIGTGRTRS